MISYCMPMKLGRAIVALTFGAAMPPTALLTNVLKASELAKSVGTSEGVSAVTAGAATSAEAAVERLDTSVAMASAAAFLASRRTVRVASSLLRLASRGV